jgi:integrase
MYYEIPFTQNAFTKAIRINNEDTEYRVINKPHLRLMVYKNKKTLMVRHCFEGRRMSKKIGTFPMMKLPLFEQLANEFIEAMESGGNYSLALRATLDQYFHQVYLPEAKKNKRSWADDESRYRLYVAPVIGKIALAKIKPYHISNLLNSLPEHLADRSHDLIRALMSVIFNRAISHELLDKSPCRTTSAKNNCNAVERYMGEVEYTAFINSCLVEVDATSAQFSFQSLCLLFALFTAVRIDNCITLTRSMLSSCKTKVYLPTTKVNKPQTIYLSTPVQWVIEQALAVSDSEFVFPSSLSETGHISHPASSFRRICIRAGIACSGRTHTVNPLFPTEKLTIHCLRKTIASVIRKHYSAELAFDDESARAASLVLGHASVEVTKRHYAFTDGENQKLAVEVAAQVFLKSIPNFPQPSIF